MDGKKQRLLSDSELNKDAEFAQSMDKMMGRKMSDRKRKSSKRKVDDDDRSMSRASSINDLASVLEQQ